MNVITLTKYKKQVIIEDYKRKVLNGENTPLYVHSNRKLYSYPEGLDTKFIINKTPNSFFVKKE